MPGNRRTSDTLYGAQNTGGHVFATVQCPIFDPRPENGNFTIGPEAAERIELARQPLTNFNPYTGQSVYVLNVLALPYYEIGIDYGFDPQKHYDGGNWARLLVLGEDILKSEGSIGGFIQRIIVRTRLADTSAKTLDARKFIMQVTTPAFGQIIQDESISTPIHPMAHSKGSTDALKEVAEEINNKHRAFLKRTANAPR